MHPYAQAGRAWWGRKGQWRRGGCTTCMIAP
jgi:hypothetical protein